MGLDIKKVANDLITKDVIAVPSDKNIVLMRNNNTYTKFLDIRAAQTKTIDKGIAKVAIPALLGFTINAVNYVLTRRNSENLRDQAEFLINEAIADNN